MKHLFLNLLLFISMLNFCGCTTQEIDKTKFICILIGMIMLGILSIGIIAGFICAGIRTIRGWFDF